MMANLTTFLMRKQIPFFAAVCALTCILAWYLLPVMAIESNRTASQTIALVDLGFSSAESTVTTYYWAATQGEVQRMFGCFSPEKFPGLDEMSFEIDMQAHVRKLWRGSEGLQILKIVNRGNDRVQVDALLVGERWGDKPDRLVLERSDNEWRIVDIRQYSPKAGGLGEVSPEPGAQPDTNPFVGIWVNEDSNTGSLTRLEIGIEVNSMVIRAWGRCSPFDCYWGEAQAVPVSNDRKDLVHVSWVKTFTNMRQEITLENENRLKVLTKHQYTDNRGREDREDTDFLVRLESALADEL